MSMTRFTVKELKEFIKDLPDETLVVSIHPGMDDCGNEGMCDGVHPFLTSDINEIRSGIIPSNDDVSNRISDSGLRELYRKGYNDGFDNKADDNLATDLIDKRIDRIKKNYSC